MSSANHKLLKSVPLTLTPISFDFILSITLSKYAMNKSGDKGSPCLVPTLVWNHLPISMPIRTAERDFP